MSSPSTPVTLPEYTPAELVKRGSTKWTAFPGALGAFVAEADFGVAPVIHQALADLTAKELFTYTPPAMLAEVKRATRDFYAREYGWEFPASRVDLVPDVINGFIAAIQVFSQPGTPIVLMTPAYMPFFQVPPVQGRDIIEVPMIRRSGSWDIDYAGLRQALAGGGLLVLCNPHNPIGKVYQRAELQALAELVDDCGARVFCDEIHSPLIHGEGVHIPYASVSEVAAGHTVTSTSASKAFNVPGLKCAQLIFSNAADQQKWAEVGFFTSHTTANPGIVANIAAYDHGGPWIAELRRKIRCNTALMSRLLAEKLPLAGFIPPVGTYLAWIDLRPYGFDETVGKVLLSQAEVAVTNGRECGEVGAGHIRVNMATPAPILTEIVERIAQVV